MVKENKYVIANLGSIHTAILKKKKKRRKKSWRDIQKFNASTFWANKHMTKQINEDE